MAICHVCGRKAVYVNPVNGRAYCKEHFVKYFEKKVRRTIRKYGMLKKDDHVVVATSGGKDSLSLLHILAKIASKNPGLKITAVLIDEGIRGYRERTIARLEKYAKEHGVDYRIASFKEYLGVTLDEIVSKSRELGLPYQPCSYCGVFRRYLLNKVTRELGGTVLATAHNLDDVVQTYLMNIVENSWDRVLKLGPAIEPDVPGMFPRRIKPFYEVLEKETALYALLNGLITPEYEQCPYAQYNIRFTIRRLLNELEERYPGTKYKLLRSLLSAIKLTQHAQLRQSLRECVLCGEPAAHPLCKACAYRLELGVLKPDEYSLLKLRAGIDRELEFFLKRGIFNKEAVKNILHTVRN